MRSNRRIIHYLTLALPGLSVLYLIHLNILSVPTNVFEIMVYVLALASWLIYKPSLKVSRRNTLMGTLLIAVIIIALIISEDLRTGFGIIKGWLIPVVLVLWLLKKHLISSQDRRLMLQVMVGQGLIVAGVALLQQFDAVSAWWIVRAPDTAQYLINGRAVSLFNSPNSAAIILALSIIISFHLARRWWHLLISLVLILALAATGSQAGVLAMFIGAVTYELVKRGYRKITALVILVSLLIINPFTLSIIASSNPDSADVRLHIWRKVWEMFLSHPVFGYGLTSFQNTFAVFTLHRPNFDEFVTPYAVHPHNIFLYAWFLFGLVGFFSLIYAFYYGLKRALQLKNALVLALLTIILIQGMVDNTVFKNDLIVWLMVPFVLIFTPVRDVSDA